MDWLTEAWDSFNEFIPVTETVSNVGNWMKDNPGGASFIAGATTGALSYMDSEKQREFDKRKMREERAWRESRSQGSSGTGNYGSHTASLTQGLLN